MEIFTAGVGIMKTLVCGIGAGMMMWGGVNLLEGYGQDNPGSKNQGIKQFVAGGGLILIGTQLVPMLSNIFN